MRLLPCAVAALFIATTPAWATPAENDAAMRGLATRSGCMACHSILPLPKRAGNLPPLTISALRSRLDGVCLWLQQLVAQRLELRGGSVELTVDVADSVAHGIEQAVAGVALGDAGQFRQGHRAD